MKEPIAHLKKDGDSFVTQSLREHAMEVSRLAREFAASFSSSEWAKVVGLLHDFGKADSAFQGYLLRENGLDDSEYDSGRINHSSSGAALVEEKFGPVIGRILAYMIAGHHAGLPDWYSAETGNAALSVRLEQDGKPNLERIRAIAGDAVAQCDGKLAPPEFVRKPENVHLWIRFLYSCLVDADFLDTEAFMSPSQSPARLGFLNLPELKTAFDAAMTAMMEAAPKTDVNAIRREILEHCRRAAILSPGLFSLTVPTGGGKTLSAMAFALEHAQKYDKRRIIYVIPYTSIIEQTADVLSKIFGRENVVEHHSNLNPEKETPRSSLASENWDAPIIVTTNVQFFESLYAAKSSRCRKLHNLVNSVVILDEAQLIPPELLKPCVDAMSQLTAYYGVTMVLATATQPALPGMQKPREMIPESARLYARLQRTEYHFPSGLTAPSQSQGDQVDWPTLAAQLGEHRQVMCVVNTRRDCYDLFHLMPEGTIHLSALMCGDHRSQIITEIKERLGKKEPIRVISTQLVEAGVDIDFPVVYRALAGLDSIAQAAGRCNREGKNEQGKLGQVYVFIPPKAAPLGTLRKGENTTRELCAIPGFDPQQPEAFARYFALFYEKVNDTGSQFNAWLVKDVNPGFQIQFRTAAAEFKLIDDAKQRPVVVRYGESPALIEQLRYAGPTRDIMRHLQRYTVNLPRYMADLMLGDGRLVEVDPVKAPGIIAQCSLKLYDEKVGLDVYRDSLPIEDLIAGN
jgi:CRISPR-associated endonuclease/helicase Cas3